MSILWMIIIGFVVGLLARAIMPGRDPLGIIMTIILGVIGSLVAGFFGQAVGLYRADEPAGFLAAVLGAMLVLFIYRQTVRGRA